MSLSEVLNIKLSTWEEILLGMLLREEIERLPKTFSKETSERIYAARLALSTLSKEWVYELCGGSND